MRLVVWLVVVLAACKDPSGKPPTGAPVADWKPIEALATTPPSTGDSNELVRALDLAKQNGNGWREHMHDQPPPDISAFPGAADALAALKAWATAKGALPPVESPMQLGVIAMSMHNIAGIAVATAKSAGDLEPAEYLGSKLVTDGRNLLEVQVGLGLLQQASNRRVALGAPPAPPPKLDLVRILAAEALQSRTTMDFADSPQGKQELDRAVKEMPEHERQSIKDVTGKSANELRPNNAQMKAMRAFWFAALSGAKRGEPTETTVARLQSAADTAPDVIKAEATIIPRSVTMLVRLHGDLANPPR